MTCGVCTAETQTGYTICWDHAAPLQQHLAELDNTIHELRITMARQDVGGPSNGSAGSTTPQPSMNLDAFDAYEQLREVTVGWAVALQGRAFYWITTTETAGSYLLTNLDMVRRQDWAPDLATELAAAVRGAVQATDRAAERITAGKCTTVIEGQQCPDMLTARQGQSHARCRTCGNTVNILEYQRARFQQAGHVRAPLGKLVRALRASGHLPGVSLKQVENWVARRRLGPVIPFKSLYTASDIMDAYDVVQAYKADLAEKIARNKELAEVG
jgi:hypothetical protein